MRVDDDERRRGKPGSLDARGASRAAGSRTHISVVEETLGAGPADANDAWVALFPPGYQ